MLCQLCTLYSLLISVADDEIEELLSLQNAILLLENTNVLAMNSLRRTTHPQLGGFRMTEAILESMDREECLYRFWYASLKFINAFIPITIARFYPEEIVCLVRVMEIPNPFRTESHYNFTAVEALCILLA